MYGYSNTSLMHNKLSINEKKTAGLNQPTLLGRYIRHYRICLLINELLLTNQIMSIWCEFK